MINWKIIKEILDLAIPAVGEMTLYMMIWILDTMMVGKYGGSLAVSSVGLSTEIIYSFFNMIVAVGISTALTSLISRAMGAKNYERAENLANAGVRIAIFLAITFFSALFFFPKEILTIAGATDRMIPFATKYAKISAFSFFILSISSTTNGIFRGVKDTKTSLYVAAIINVFNLSFDYILIFGRFGFPEMGVAGAATATIIGNLAGIFFQWTRFRKLPFKINPLKKITKSEVWDIVKLATPSGLQEANFSLSKLLGLTFIMTLGTVAFAANQIAIALEAVSIMPCLGIAIATTALVGHSAGENNFDKAKEYTLYSTIISSIVMGILGFVFFFFPEFLVSLFIQKQEPEVVRFGALCLKIGAFEQIPIAFVLAVGAYFKGLGDAKTPFYISFVSNWIIRLPLAYYMIFVLHFPVYYFWIITGFQWLLEGGVLYLFYSNSN